LQRTAARLTARIPDPESPGGASRRLTAEGFRTEVTVKSAATEATIATQIQLPCRVTYVRIPVIDHCWPSEDAANRFIELCRKIGPADWVHFHCHGGDGRTTTFLAMYDMVCWARRATSEFPSLEDFAERECHLFEYCLDPDGCTSKIPNRCTGTASATRDWKYFLAFKRWVWLGFMRDFIAGGGLAGGQPFALPEDWYRRISLEPQ
jgi:hypothetical protein